jgi:hypothetical protein
MHIANPIYDVVFKFMMEDKKVAKAFISAIIGEKVLELDFAAQEHTVRVPKTQDEKEKEKKEEVAVEYPGTCFTVCRFDFSAKIALPSGDCKTVLIELQKAKLASDIMRFRRYVGLHYGNPANTYTSGEETKPCQIYCIFLLGYDINIPGRPVIQVDYHARDIVTHEELNPANDFIQSLHHRSWIVQIKQLKQRRRNDLEKLLDIFDQENLIKNNHTLNVKEEDFPKVYHPIIRRLRIASESEDIQVEMEMEDDYLQELQDKERLVGEKDKIIAEKDKVIEENEKVIGEKDKALEENEKVIEELKKQLAAARKQK